MRFRPIVLPFLAAALLGACSATASGSPQASAQAPTAQPSASSSAALDGRTFVSTGVNGHDLVAKSTVTLTFKDGQISANAGCNTMSGAYTIGADGTLGLGSMAATAMGCPAAQMAQDQWLAQFLPGSTVKLDGDTLTLTKDNVSLTLVDQTTTNLPLENTTWVVTGLVSNSAVSTVPQGVKASLVFSGGQVAVDTGCNTGGGPATFTDTTITFGAIALSKKACPADATQVEQLVVSVLDGAQPYAITADTLKIGGNGKPGLMLTGTK
jgi:heat shock protein HslJ